MKVAYIRSTDGAEMIEVAPHQYVNRVVLIRLGAALKTANEK